MRYTSILTGFGLLAGTVLGTTDLQAQYYENSDPYYRQGDYNNRYYEKSDRYNQQGNVSIRGGVEFAVGTRPEAPWVKPVPMPSDRHVWMPNEWQWHNGRYVCVPGHWVRPAYSNMRYVPGYWNKTKHGWVWRSGHWSEVKSKKKGHGHHHHGKYD